MTNLRYAHYNTKEQAFSDAENYLCEINEAYLFNSLEDARETVGSYDEPEDWKVVGVRVFYETFEV